MQAGYHSKGSVASCEVWLEAWRDVLRLADRFDLATIDDFDERFGGTQCLFNWVQDLELELGNAGVDDERFVAERTVRRELSELQGVHEGVSVERLSPEAVRIRHTLDFGEPGLPLERLPELQVALHGGTGGGGAVKVGRNEPCPCGSGKKFKKCCGRVRSS